MADKYSVFVDNENTTSKKFYRNLKTKVKVEKNTQSTIFDNSWLDLVESVVPYINKIYENPKKFIKNEEEILKIEKTKKVTIDSIKHLSKHTDFISKFDPETGDITPDKLLNVLKEETYNTYENRFAFTLVDVLEDFIKRVEEVIFNTENRKDNAFFCDAATNIDEEEVKFIVRIESNKYKKSNTKDEDLKNRINAIKNSITSWKQSGLYKGLIKERAAKVTNPLNKTNVILKNPNFQQAAMLWDFLHSFHINENSITSNTPDSVSTLPDNLQRLVDTSLMFCYLAMNMADTSGAAMSNLDYNDIIKDAAQNLFKDVISSIDEDDADVTDRNFVDEDSNGYKLMQQIKGIDSNIISKKIKETVDKYMEKANDMYFELKGDIK